jgi:hypothetical protein
MDEFIHEQVKVVYKMFYWNTIIKKKDIFNGLHRGLLQMSFITLCAYGAQESHTHL